MLELTIKLILFLFPLAYSPGPGNLFFAVNGARFGFSKTLAASAGYHIATWLVTFLIGIGFGKIANAWPIFWLAINYIGGAYVFYLAWKMISAAKLTSVQISTPANFYDGALLLLLNPKAYAIITIMFAQFGDVGHSDFLADNFLWLIVWITTIFTLNNLIAFSVWTYAGDKLLRRFRSAASTKKLNLIFGIALAMVAIWIVVG